MVPQIVCRREDSPLPCQVEPAGVFVLAVTEPYKMAATEADL
jgi:hypothetical protein